MPNTAGNGPGKNLSIHTSMAPWLSVVLTVSDPELFFARELQAGAIEIFPVGEDYGWKLGRLADPFGLHWEIGYQLD